jgi:hypothetical protein
MLRYPILVLPLLTLACAPTPMMPGRMGNMPDMDRMNSQRDMMMEYMKDSDAPQWKTQREQIVNAMGDRIFDKDFNRVFDSITVALGTLECNVQNMERQSGYINASIPAIDPMVRKQIEKQSLADWARGHGYDPKLTEKTSDYDMDISMMDGMGMIGRTMNISVVKQTATQVKVKIRFANLHEPKYVEEAYKKIWPAIDKQIFLDKNLD